MSEYHSETMERRLPGRPKGAKNKKQAEWGKFKDELNQSERKISENFADELNQFEERMSEKIEKMSKRFKDGFERLEEKILAFIREEIAIQLDESEDADTSAGGGDQVEVVEVEVMSENAAPPSEGGDQVEVIQVDQVESEDAAPPAGGEGGEGDQGREDGEDERDSDEEEGEDEQDSDEDEKKKDNGLDMLRRSGRPLKKNSRYYRNSLTN